MVLAYENVFCCLFNPLAYYLIIYVPNTKLKIITKMAHSFPGEKGAKGVGPWRQIKRLLFELQLFTDFKQHTSLSFVLYEIKVLV